MPPPVSMNVNEIGNKIKRTAILAAQRLEKSKAKASAKRARDESGLPRVTNERTLESTRTLDDTFVGADDAEVAGDEADDEFARVFAGLDTPKVMLTTSRLPSAKLFPLLGALLGVLPGAAYYRRRHFPISSIARWAGERGFSHLVVVVERAKAAQTLIVARLPGGPTASFRFSSPQLPADIDGHGARTAHAPEIILNNFKTRLGRRFGRLLGSLWPHTPAFEGRQVVTLHNQRDFIFFRHHRYAFDAGRAGGGGGGEDGGPAARLQELGPRFTLKPQWLLAGGFDPRAGEYEFMRPSKANADTASKRTFAL